MAAKFEIEKFNGTNFSLWTLKMKVVLRNDNCLEAIDKGPAEITDDNKWNEMDGNAMENIHLALADNVLSSIKEKKIAKEIWDHLTKLYETKSLHNKIFLKRKLYTLRMSESTSMTEHMNTLNTLFSQLALLGYKIEPNERAELLLQSLLDSYDQLVINLKNNILIDYLSFDDVVSAVLEEENRRKNKEDKLITLQQAEALTVTRGRPLELAAKIKEGQSHEKDSNPQGNVASTINEGGALSCEAVTTTEGKKRMADGWFFDSGATYHMTSRREWFHNYKPISGGSLFSCNDHALKIVDIGTIKLKLHDNIVCTIQQVRHVENLKKNLLLLGQLDDLDCKVVVEKRLTKLIKGALVLMKGRKVDANLYMLEGETLQEGEASVASSSSGENLLMMWHCKLGHMSEQGLKVLVEQNLLPGLTKVSLYFCEHCVTNNGRESISNEFVEFCNQESIKRQFTTAYTPQQNGVAERMNRTLLERTRAMLGATGLKKAF
ncbi:Gag-Pol [Cucumis melo var. makuwa]|uniref:Gag-Pol n=1 Tax=Cucumis melo var. makuwa TaxID=1194695 RepID=A0A5A7SNG9_CUCMM|nr:Gag-Pol [Cucumis melo var. makuwa]TYK11620.1 Gag-Pol [Cucumis melo var. makuwa]